MNGDSEIEPIAPAPKIQKKKFKDVRRYYKQRYLTRWENDPNYKGWLTKSKKGMYFFYCKVCDTDLKGGLSELQRHKRGKKHQDKIQNNQNNGLHWISEKEVLNHNVVTESETQRLEPLDGIMLSPDTHIGFLGAGRMAQALAGGFIKAELITADRMWASSPPEDQIFLDQTKLLGLNVTYDNREVVEKCDVIIIAVKPHVVEPVLKEVADLVKIDHLFISIAAGITISAVEKALPEKTRVVRIMPNTPALVGCSASVFAEGHSVNQEDANITSLLFSSIGICERGTESMLDAVTGLSGSGPAYIFMVIEALADGGVKMGLSRPLAQKLAAQTVMGTAKMVLETQMHPGELKDNVCSPGGTTIYGVHKLENCGVRSAFISAVEAATCRSKELGKE